MLADLKHRKLSPGGFIINACDEKFTDEDLTDEGNAFTRAYFDFKTGKYLGDYNKTLLPAGLSLYHVPDTWESFDKLAPVISQRFHNWERFGTEEAPTKQWWKFWS